jgi:hypothetical protein
MSTTKKWSKIGTEIKCERKLGKRGGGGEDIEKDQELRKRKRKKREKAQKKTMSCL